MKSWLFPFFIFQIYTSLAQPVRMAVAGTSHGHHSWILGRQNDSAVVLVGIYEPSKELAAKMAQRYGLDQSLFFDDLVRMLEATKPEGVLAFGSTFEHLSVVEAAVPRRIPVMVEKPLATTVVHAERIQQLSQKYGVPVLTNYETSWYPVTDKTHALTRDTSFMGRIRKVVVHDGHPGPKEIGVSKEFFEWLTDPVLNGGGALTDFGCYGANLMTHLMDGQVPLTVTAVTQQLKPHIYPKVDDEATIILAYPTAQCIIQASWNWPYNRKDMAVYGEAGYAVTKDAREMRVKGRSGREEVLTLTPEQTGTYTSPFLYFADVIRGRLKVPPYGLYSLENNVLVIRILEAARESAQTGKGIRMREHLQ